jgi:hypothetical protein
MPRVCLLNPCFSSTTNVEYKEKGREVTVENQLNKMENTKD